MTIKNILTEMVASALNESDDKIHKLFADTAEKYRGKEAAASSSPSGPNTSKFTAVHSGMIEHKRNLSVAREHPFRPDSFDHFIKIGSNVDSETRQNIVKDIHSGLKKLGHKSVNYKGESNDDLGNHKSEFMRTIDKKGDKHEIKKTSGSSWGGIGIHKTS
jgi:hypothetical protein